MRLKKILTTEFATPENLRPYAAS